MNSITPALIGSRLAKARNSLGLSQDQVAEALGVKRPLISYWESGHRTIDSVNLSKLAALYGYSIHHFLAGPEAEFPEVNLGFRAKELSKNDLLTIGWAKRLVANLADLKEVMGSEEDWV